MRVSRNQNATTWRKNLGMTTTAIIVTAAPIPVTSPPQPDFPPELVGPQEHSHPHKNGAQEGASLPENRSAGGHARLDTLALGQISESGDLPNLSRHVAPQVGHHEHADGGPHGQPGASQISHDSAPHRGRP